MRAWCTARGKVYVSNQIFGSVPGVRSRGLRCGATAHGARNEVGDMSVELGMRSRMNIANCTALMHMLSAADDSRENACRQRDQTQQLIRERTLKLGGLETC